MATGTKKIIRARVSSTHDIGLTEIKVAFERAVLGNYEYEFSGILIAHCWVTDSFEGAYGFVLAYQPSVHAQLDEMRAATKKLEAMERRMEAQRKELGEAKTFAEFARRAIVAAGAKETYVATEFGRPCRVDDVSPMGPKDGARILHAIEALEKIAVERYGKKAA